MSTRKQRRANRLNAQKSTGPRTPEGKRVSSQNALKSGLDAKSQIVPGESPEEFAELQAEYFEQFAPAGAEQRFLVDKLIRNEWLLRRYHRVEAQLWVYQTRLCDRAGGVELGEAYTKAATIFLRLHRQINAAEKAHKEALEELKSLQPPPEPTETKDETAQLASFLTSVPEALPTPCERSEPPLPGPRPLSRTSSSTLTALSGSHWRW
jgi:hypothetical protein